MVFRSLSYNLLSRLSTFSLSAGMNLEKVISSLNRLAPLSYAETWDNVGLLVEPNHLDVNKILLCNDLTEDVLQEAMDVSANMVISYHPPIFASLKRITQNHWKQRIVALALEKRIAIFSPHTSWDAMEDGVNDWLISAFDFFVKNPICVKSSAPAFPYEVVFIASDLLLLEKLRNCENCCNLDVAPRSEKELVVKLVCGEHGLQQVTKLAGSEKEFQIALLQNIPLSNVGSGREARFKSPLKVSEVVDRVKKHLMLDHLVLALGRGVAADSNVTSVSVCAGSGGSLLKNVTSDIILTGEMSHHEVLDHVAAGRTVIICFHSNTERGYLRVFSKRLETALDGVVEISLSQKDREPMTVV